MHIGGGGGYIYSHRLAESYADIYSHRLAESRRESMAVSTAEGAPLPARGERERKSFRQHRHV
jgi:hypothetical protein